MLNLPNNLVIDQKIEPLEMFFGFESANSYKIKANGKDFLYAAEKSGILWKFIFSAQRPLEIRIFNLEKKVQFIIRRSFFFFFPAYALYDEYGDLVGKVRKQFSLLNTKYAVYDSSNQKVAQIVGPFWRPWTFKVKDSLNQEVALIGKKFSGLKEFFSDSDNFQLRLLNDELEIPFKALFLAACLAVDYDCFDLKPKKTSTPEKLSESSDSKGS